MSKIAPQLPKRSKKEQRELEVLLALVELYIQTGKPIGSNTLKEAGFPKLSSATIRNYFAHLESEGYLQQAHASGGRAPTSKAYQIYANEHHEARTIAQSDVEVLRCLKRDATREIASYLQEAAEILSQLTGTAVFLSAPRFDHDLMRDLKLVPIDSYRCLAVLVTEFGVVHTELLQTDEALSNELMRRISSYFGWRVGQAEQPDDLAPEEEELAQTLYNELMVRYIVGYSNFTNEDIHRCGFSQLLQYPEFADAVTLAGGLSLFENHHSMRLLLRETQSKNKLCTWVGSELLSYMPDQADCAVIAVPYRVRQSAVGGIGLLGPSRLPYQQLFGILRVFTEYVSETLTRSVVTHKISYREADGQQPYIESEERQMIKNAEPIMLEYKQKKMSRKARS